MKLTSIIINNLFSYYGKQEVLIEPITYIIGTNGYGKTSILNSIKLCLGHADVKIESILNNNATEPFCSITLVFDKFTVERSWDFSDKIKETFYILFDKDHIIEGSEAEHFIQNKFPAFLIDFLFYDGEIGSNLFLLSRTRLKNLFDYVFDLDLLMHIQKDSHQAAKNLLEMSHTAETAEYVELESKRLALMNAIKGAKEPIATKEKELKALALNIQKLDTEIRNRNKKVKTLHKEQDVKQEELNVLSHTFKELIMFQMPLLLNPSLLEGIQRRTHSPLSVNDEKLFSNHFKRFLNEINSSHPEEEALSAFKNLMLTESSSITLSMNKEEFTSLLEKMKNLQFEIQQLTREIHAVEASSMEQEITRSLIEARDQQQEQFTELQHAIEDIKNQQQNDENILREVNKLLTRNFKTNQETFAFIEGYKELQRIADVSAKVYNETLIEKLVEFNATLQKNTAVFLAQYKHINEIYLDDKHNIVIGDGEKRLDIALLSAGQKQVLNFLIVKSILEFKQFASFVMVDTPFGRLSNENKKLLLNDCYRKFDHLILLLTDSEFEFVQSQNLEYIQYDILRDDNGSKIEKVS